MSLYRGVKMYVIGKKGCMGVEYRDVEMDVGAFVCRGGVYRGMVV